jgi:hypothetical protein
LEEIKIRQRSRDRDILEWDRITAYFHAIVNQRSRKKFIDGLEGHNGIVDNLEEMIKIAREFYKDLFSKEQREDIALDQSFWDNEDLITQEENDMLTAPFTEGEIKEVIFSCYAEGAPRPDGLSFLFYQKFWEVIKKDLVDMFNYFHKGDLDLHRLNFAMLTLVPKTSDARNMKNFRPISLANCSFKIFSKVLSIRLGKIAGRIILNNQSAFIKGRYILESVVTTHEIVHSVSRGENRASF